MRSFEFHIHDNGSICKTLEMPPFQFLLFGIKPFRWPGLVLFSAYIATKSLVKISIAYHILNPMYAHTKFDTSQIMPLYLKAIGSSAF